MLKRLLIAAVFTTTLTSCSRSKPPESGAQARAPNVDPQAIEALKRMGAFLREQQAFSIESRLENDELLEFGQKIQRTGTASLDVQRPDHLHAVVDTDRRQREFFYNGSTFVATAPVANTFAAVPLQGSLQQLVEIARARYGIRLPLAELFLFGTEPAELDQIRSAVVVGPSTIDGVETMQYALRQPGIDWQVWIEQGDRPLPRKLVVTRMEEPSQPQYVAVLDWDLEPQFGANAFTYVPDAGAQQISLGEIPQQRPPE